MKEYSLYQYLTKIFWNRDTFLTTIYYPTKKGAVPLQNMEGSCIDFVKYPNLYRLLLLDMKFCFRYQQKENKIRAFIEKSYLDGMALKNIEIITAYGDTLEEVTESLEEKCKYLERGKR